MDEQTQVEKRAELFLLGQTKTDDVQAELLEVVGSPIADRTLGGFDVAVDVDILAAESALLRIALPDPLSVGIAPESIRLFRVTDGQPAQPVWNSGYAAGVGMAWAVLRESGTYVPIGLPRDRFVEGAIRQLATDRRLGDGPAPGKDALRRTLSPLLDGPPDAIAEIRRFLTALELQTGTERPRPGIMEQDPGGHLRTFRLPGGLDPEGFAQRARKLHIPEEGLPEEVLFFPPDPPPATAPPWPLSPDWDDWDGLPIERLRTLEDTLERLREIDWLRPLPWPWPWLRSKNWWMHQHDQRHTGHASGPSDITRNSVNRMVLHRTLPVNGPVISKPAIVDGSIYIGAGRQGGSGGTLYKFDLATGAKQGEFPTTGMANYNWVNGIGGSPAVTGGKVYFTGVHGKVYCLDAGSMTPAPPYPAPLWETDLDVADFGKNQPVNQSEADCWSGPLVVGDRVFIGCGEGEDPNTYGFIYCLDANTGRVNWLFCTSKFAGAGNNVPNVLPAAIAAPWAAAAGFTVAANPPESGSSVWSSCAYDATLDRIYVGTGNSQYNWTATESGTEQPDDAYGSGLIALDAGTGAFRGFFQPTPDDSYWPGDYDIDVPGAPTIVGRGSDRVVAFGSKNGSFFLLDPDTLAPVARRQMLPRAGGSGVPGDRGTGIPAIVPTPNQKGENSYGIFGTPAVHFGSGRLFIGIGGYNGMALSPGTGIDPTSTPFIRAVDWNTLLDAWPTTLGSDGISRYTTARPPVYTTTEVGLSSPAVVNDVVFISTDKAALYALDVGNGQCLWSAPGLPSTGFTFAMGPAIYGNYVVLGAGPNVYVYRLGWRFPPLPPRLRIDEILLRRWPWPPPPPPPPEPPWWLPGGTLAERESNRITPRFLATLVVAAAVVAAVVFVTLAALALR